MTSFKSMKLGLGGAGLTALLTAISAAGCTQSNAGSEVHSTFLSKYRVASPQVDLCFKAGADAAELIPALKELIELQYSKRTPAAFQVEDSCVNPKPNVVVVELQSTGYSPLGRKHRGVTSLYYRAAGAKMKIWTAACRSEKYSLNAGLSQMSASEKEAYQACAMQTFAHELGHVLGLADEEFNAGSGKNCGRELVGTSAHVSITEYDPKSIMSYCNPLATLKSEVTLSDKDIEGLNLLYPPKTDVSQNQTPPVTKSPSILKQNAPDAPSVVENNQMPAANPEQMSEQKTASNSQEPSQGAAPEPSTGNTAQQDKPSTTAPSVPPRIHEAPINAGILLHSKHTKTTYFKSKANSSALLLPSSEYCAVAPGSGVAVTGVSSSVVAKHMKVILAEEIPGCAFGRKGQEG